MVTITDSTNHSYPRREFNPDNDLDSENSTRTWIDIYNSTFVYMCRSEGIDYITRHFPLFLIVIGPVILLITVFAILSLRGSTQLTEETRGPEGGELKQRLHD